MTNEQQFVAMQIARGKFCKTFDKLMQSINRVIEKFCMKQIYSMRKTCKPCYCFIVRNRFGRNLFLQYRNNFLGQFF